MICDTKMRKWDHVPPTWMILQSQVLLRLRNAGIKLHPKKSQFGYEEIKLLGFVVNSKGISPDPEKVEAIVKMRRPRTVKQLRSFLGTCNFYRAHIPRFSFTAYPLYQLIKDEAEMKPSVWESKWVEVHEAAFQELNTKLAYMQILFLYDESLELEVSCDASSENVAC